MGGALKIVRWLRLWLFFWYFDILWAKMSDNLFCCFVHTKLQIIVTQQNSPCIPHLYKNMSVVSYFKKLSRVLSVFKTRCFDSTIWPECWLSDVKIVRKTNKMQRLLNSLYGLFSWHFIQWKMSTQWVTLLDIITIFSNFMICAVVMFEKLSSRLQSAKN